MRRIFRPSEVTQRLLRPWRDQAGEALTALLILSGVVSAILSGFGAGAALLTLEDRRELSSCLQRVNALTQNLQLKYGATGIVPLDDPNVTEIRNCKTYVDQLVKQPHLGNSAAIHTLQTNVNGTLSGLTACRIIAVAPNPPLAGDRSFYVSANIPLTGVTASGTISLTVAGIQLSAPATPDGYLWEGFVGVPVAVSRQAAGTVSPVSVTARSDVGRLPSGACPSGADASTPGKCFVGCTTPTVNVVWKDPPIPEIKLFLAAPSTIDKAKPTPVTLTWNVKNATSISIDQGVGEVDAQGFTLELPPDQDTTYTLTAVGVRPADTKTATQKVTVKGSTPFAVSITSPKEFASVGNTDVLVTGKVSPAPSASGVLTASIRMNGTPTLSVPVDGAGNFSGTVTLQKKATASNLTVDTFNTTVISCDTQSTEVFVNNRLADYLNIIDVTVTAGSQTASSASVTVFHTVLLNSLGVTWTSGCFASTLEALNMFVAPAQTVLAGKVVARCNKPGGCVFSCPVRVSVGSAVGKVETLADWTFATPACP
jgi:hypothetical protein